MRVPLSWLAEYVDVDLAPEALAERLTLLGMEVKGIERRGAEWQHVVIGELLTVEKHPRADRLSLTTVTIGSGEPLSIVCGATNIAPGQRVPVALPGAVLPGDRRIERTEKMGVVSNGMLCSGDELRLTDDGDGILILPGDAPLGRPLIELYGDVVLDVDVKPNRGDALSIIGLAREVAAITGGELRWPEIGVVERGTPTGERLRVTVEDPTLCPRFVGRLVRGVRVAASPSGVQMRLIAAGIRPISNVVDASNYVLLELGKPIHTFDAGAVADGDLVVRLARAGEHLETLDHVDRELDPETLLIADRRGPLAIAGVMGGATSEVSDGTTEIIIESAIFDPVSIRRTAFRYALRSEASLRFEKGQEFRLARIGADRTAQLIAAWAGGDVAPGRVDTSPIEPDPERVRYRPARVSRLLGMPLAPGAQIATLARVGIAAAAPAGASGTVDVPVSRGALPLTVAALVGEVLEAIVPTWRRDIVIEADLIEEIARLEGYDRVPATLPSTQMPSYRPSPLALRDAVRAWLAGEGLHEVVTHALVSPRHIGTFAWHEADAPAAGEERAGGTPISVTNPLSADHAVLRQGLVGGLLDVIALNKRRGTVDAAIFEVGKGYGIVDGAASEWWRLGIGLAGSFDPSSWNRPARAADLDDLKGIVEGICRMLGASAPAFLPLTDEPILHPGRSAHAAARDAAGALVLSGRIGQIHPTLALAWDERVEGAFVAELSIRGLSGGQLSVPRGTTPSRYPDVERDLAIVVADGRAAGEIESVLQMNGGTSLRGVHLFDIYRGPPLAADVCSFAFRLVFGAPDRMLTEGEVDAAITAVVDALSQVSATIRS